MDWSVDCRRQYVDWFLPLISLLLCGVCGDETVVDSPRLVGRFLRRLLSVLANILLGLSAGRYGGHRGLFGRRHLAIFRPRLGDQVFCKEKWRS